MVAQFVPDLKPFVTQRCLIHQLTGGTVQRCGADCRNNDRVGYLRFGWQHTESHPIACIVPGHLGRLRCLQLVRYVLPFVSSNGTVGRLVEWERPASVLEGKQWDGNLLQ